MQTNVNPDTGAERISEQFKNALTAFIDEQADFTEAIDALERAGFSPDQICAFMGEEGLERLDVHGKSHGFLSRVIRGIEFMRAEERTYYEQIERGLKTGGYFVAVRTDGSDQQRSVVENILKAHQRTMFAISARGASSTCSALRVMPLVFRRP